MNVKNAKVQVFFVIVLITLFTFINTKTLLAGSLLKSEPKWTLVFEDNFDGPVLDSSVWNFEEKAWPYNEELEYYTSRTVNAYFENGSLVLQALKENYGKGNNKRKYTSARIQTEKKVKLIYGKIEARIKLPYGQGIWPAFWTLGDDISRVSWPYCGEIDILEMIGGGKSGNRTHHASLHWDDGGHQMVHGSAKVSKNTRLADDYHVFGIEWNEDEILWFFDGVEFYSMELDDPSMSELHWDHHILFNLAVGGKWPGNPDETTVFPQKMYIDWVRWYQLK